MSSQNQTSATGNDFRNIYRQGFARIAACTLPVRLADPRASVEGIIEQVKACADEGVAVALFPELSVSGYSAEDLLLQEVLLDDTLTAIATLARETAALHPVIVVGAPLAKGTRLFNCAVVLHRGRVLGVVPKSYLPNYREFYEKRHFASGENQYGEQIVLRGVAGPTATAGEPIPFGPDLIFSADDVPGLQLHVEICEDMWIPVPPSALAALAGANVLLNLSGSPITVGRAEDRHVLARSASSRCLAAYAYAAAGEGESTTDLSWDGMTMIYENGDLLAESPRFPTGPQRSVADVDLDRIRQQRMRQGSFDDNFRALGEKTRFRTIAFSLQPPTGDLGLRRKIDRFPFVPDDETRLAQDCYEAYSIQVSALERRLLSMTSESFQPKIIIGVSGGLDSTHALIVAAKVMDRLGRPRTDILAWTMPGFATSDHTKDNAISLSRALGVTFEELDIRPAAKQMLLDMGHPFGRGEEVYDVTFENVQAGLRTDFLFRFANQRGGIVLGTGDLSELALGWCTYGVGDQMSHYGVNAGVPKTLMQHLIKWVITSEQFEDEVSSTLDSIVNTEITPELVPTTDTEGPQSTQAKIGPYALQDFTLYHVLRRGARPSKIAFIAESVWAHADVGEWPSSVPEDERAEFTLPEIVHWLELFITRFFANQFKRSALPNGPKVVNGGTLSPRGDWRMPSDASAAAWLAELRAGLPELD